MKALTLHQPWATLIAQGTKVYETRSWPPPSSLIGQRIAIHAGKSYVGALEATDLGLNWDELPRGVVVCTARLVAAHCIRFGTRLPTTPEGRAETESMSMAQAQDDLCHPPKHLAAGTVAVAGDYGTIPIDEYGDYAPGRWAWRLVDVELLEPPVPARGRQGLWNWEPAA